jgi:serine/threonine-protein kinase
LLETGLTFTAPQSVSQELGIMALLGSNAAWQGSSAANPILEPATGMDVWIIDLGGDRTPHPFLNTRANEFHPAFSNDGRWLAYASDQSGREEVYVRPYPGPGRVVQVSIGGGAEPLWSPSRDELYYRSIDGLRVMRVPFRTEPGFAAQAPQLLFEGPFVTCCPWGRTYDITPDGERFLMIRDAENRTAPLEFEVVLNWFEELRETMAAQGGR